MTLQEKPDWITIASENESILHQDQFTGFIMGADHVWSSHVEPLQKELEQTTDQNKRLIEYQSQYTKRYEDLAAERDKLKSDNDNLVSVMIAAAEEIQEHWQAHCDEEGYGPQNLMMRLEKGIPANYPGYKFGAFTKMQEQIEHLQALLRNRDAYIESLESKKD